MASTFLGLPAVAPRGVGGLHADESFPQAARAALGNEQLRRNLGHATATIRAKRAAVVGEVPEWEELRRAGEAIKAATMSRLDEHLVMLEQRVTEPGRPGHLATEVTKP